MNWAAFFTVVAVFAWIYGTILGCVLVEGRYGTHAANTFVFAPSFALGLAVIFGVLTA